MSLLRIIGYVGLALLAVIVLFCIYLTYLNGDWWGIAIGIGALVLFAFLGNALWLEGFRQKRPYVIAVPNRTILALFFVVLGVTGIAESIERFTNGHWFLAIVAVLVAFLMFEGAYRVWANRT